MIIENYLTISLVYNNAVTNKTCLFKHVLVV